jgi:hypothetical protein
MGRVGPLVPLVLLAGVVVGCGVPPAPVAPASTNRLSDPDKVRAADVSVLFVGNSHTNSHDLPGLVADLLRSRRPERTVYTHVVWVGFLEDLPGTAAAEEVDTRPWKHVVLQAQKESKSGRVRYSTAAGEEFARRGIGRGAAVHFYAEWGLQDTPGHGARIEQVYREMAAASGAGVAPVGRAWDLALAARPDLPLYATDGNHQSELGAFLTACVLAGRIGGDDPTAYATFPYPSASAADREFLAGKAAEALAAAP